MDLTHFVRNGKLSVHVKPNSSETRVTGFDKERVLIDVAAPPEDNKANLELLKFVKRQLGRPVLLKSGATSRDKVLVLA
ncbi:MAG TPA: DUF167 domain-containing protein [Candidatus Binatia bacterium]|nr:DUF167 domain-containing protein [Candidatus Binatia bacterium]